MESTHPVLDLITKGLLFVFIGGLAFLLLRTMLTMSSLLLSPVARIVTAIPLLRKIVTAQRGDPPDAETHNVETTSAGQGRRPHTDW